MNLWTKMHKAEERVKIKRELRKRNIHFRINESIKKLNSRLRECEDREDRCIETNILKEVSHETKSGI